MAFSQSLLSSRPCFLTVALLLSFWAHDCSAWTTSTLPRQSLLSQSSRRKASGVVASSRVSSSALLATDDDTQDDATSAAASTSTTTTEQFHATDGSVIVTVDCKLIPEGDDFVPEPLFDGVVLHQEDEYQELTFVLGQGNYLPGLHEIIATELAKEGDGVTNQSCDAGWGQVNPDLIATLSFQQSGLDPKQIQVGTQLMLANGLKCRVTEINNNDDNDMDATFTIDANPPMAGASYLASVTLKNVYKEGFAALPIYSDDNQQLDEARFQVATFALGCFWGGELELMRQPGVVGTWVGYTQGQLENPSYQEVCSGSTGHTEAIAVVYDSTVTSYEHLTHVAMNRLGQDKYLLNQVGNDQGTQYRHGVYYHTPEQKKIAQDIVQSFGEDCVTECLPATTFYKAEDYHQQYLLKGGQSARKGDATTIRCYG